MRQIDITADELSSALLALADTNNVCILDSCGVGHLGSHLMIAGVQPVDVIEITDSHPNKTLKQFEEYVKRGHAVIFSISYDLGPKLEGLRLRNKEYPAFAEPDIFLALFDCLVIHDYTLGNTILTGNSEGFSEIEDLLNSANSVIEMVGAAPAISSNFTQTQYIAAVEKIKEYIRQGETYQTNLTQQFHAQLPQDLTAETIFTRLRRDHPAPFAAFIKRLDSMVVSASPERFFRISGNRISASPIKGTRPRGKTVAEDDAQRAELSSSEKDRAENTMIVDLLRNDLGRVCKFGTVEVETLCALEEHPTLFHLVSTIHGELREDVTTADVIRALFPCGSITGAPKIRTMQIIDEFETAGRGLSMGAIGYCVPEDGFEGLESGIDLSVAIRTMVVWENEAVFNVGGGITIDSNPAMEYEESLVKAKALLAALGTEDNKSEPPA